MQKINTLIFYKAFFTLSCFISLLISNLFYMTTIGPDFNRYKIYLLYFFGEPTEYIPEQGFIYFLVIAFFCFLQIGGFDESFTKNISELGNQSNFNINFISDFEHRVNLGIQYGNFVIFLVGLYGIYKMLQFKKTNHIDIFKILTIITILPLSFQLRLSMKPEILAFALIPFAILNFEKYIKTKSNKYLLGLTIIFPMLFTSKASIFGMVVILFAILAFLNKDKINLKNILFFLVLCILLTSFLGFENYKINNFSIFERSELVQYFDQQEYNNKADPSVFYNINLRDLVLNPNKNFHNNSLIGITLLDTFGDYFNEYWNKDYTFFKTNRKEFITSGQELSLDRTKKVLTIPISIFSLEKLRSFVGVVLSLIFFYLLFKSFYKKSQDWVYVISPLIGIFILIISSLGFPENNFNPETGDTFKGFYYSFFTIISIVFLLNNYVKKNKLTNIKIIIITILFSFILGFPKANNTSLDSTLYEINSYTMTCELNKLVINVMVIEKFEKECIKTPNQKNNTIKFKNLPIINLLTLFSFIVLVFLNRLRN